MRLTSADALASVQALNRNASDDLELVSCSDSLARTVATLALLLDAALDQGFVLID